MWRFRTFVVATLALCQLAANDVRADAGGVPRQIQELQAAVTSLTTQLKVVQTAVSTIQADNTQLRTLIQGLQTQLQALQAANAQQDVDIAALQAKNVQQDGAIAAIQTRLAALGPQSCPQNQYVNGIASSGGLSCAPVAGNSTLVNLRQAANHRGIPSNYPTWHEVIRLDVAPGDYAIVIAGTASEPDFVHGNVALECRLLATSQSGQNQLAFLSVYIFDAAEAAMTMEGMSRMTEAGYFSIECRTSYDGIELESLHMLTFKVNGFF